MGMCSPPVLFDGFLNNVLVTVLVLHILGTISVALKTDDKLYHSQQKKISVSKGEFWQISSINGP
jgi:hypothetical protein